MMGCERRARRTKRVSAETTATRELGWEKRQWMASGPMVIPTPTPAITRNLAKCVMENSEKADMRVYIPVDFSVVIEVNRP